MTTKLFITTTSHPLLFRHSRLQLPTSAITGFLQLAYFFVAPEQVLQPDRAEDQTLHDTHKPLDLLLEIANETHIVVLVDSGPIDNVLCPIGWTAMRRSAMCGLFDTVV
jgi:hypothetical protein